MAAEGVASRAIGREVGCTTGTASKWRVRYANRRAGLNETGNRGAEPKYTADRYGFSVDVPASFEASAPPDNNDGLTFNSPDGRVEIRAYGHLLSDGENLVDDERETERYSAEDHLHVTYRQATAHNFTMSGLKGDHIVYVRAVATCKGIAAATLWVEYPQSAKPQLDPLIAHMAKTLMGSNACWAPG